MKTEEQLIAKIAKHFNVSKEKVSIGEYEMRENWRGEKLKEGRPALVEMNTGVGVKETVNEFIGWIINGRWYKENC